MISDHYFYFQQEAIYTLSLHGSQPPLDTVHCPDDKSLCPDEHTCCRLKDHEGYGCCAGLNAVCCADQLHCCPENTVCNETAENCTKIIHTLPILSFDDLLSRYSGRSIICPDGKTTCEDQNTCCPLITGGYGCCKTPEAYCCDDKLHCCPHGYSCNPNSDKCSHDNINFAEVLALPLITKTCPDDSKVCGINDTCCQHLDKSWACCPIENAVCCSDGYHCCPQNYTCDLKDSTCKKKEDSDISLIDSGTKILPGLTIVSSRYYKTIDATRTIMCPSKNSKCKDEDTCCQLSSGDWGCCPSKEAVCCSDKQYCCPRGFKCESGGKCLMTAHKDLL